MGTVDLHTVIASFDRPDSSCRKSIHYRMDFFHYECSRPLCQLFQRDIHVAGRHRRIDAETARMVELHKGLAPARMDGIHQTSMLRDHVIGGDQQLLLRRTRIWKNAAVFCDDDARFAADGTAFVILDKRICHMAVLGFVRLHRRHDKPVLDSQFADGYRLV